MRQSNLHSLGLAQTIAPVTKTEGLTGDVTTGSGVDLQGFEGATFHIQLGTIVHADSTGAITFEESDDDSSYSAVAAADIIGDDVVSALVVATSGANRKKGYIGTKRYVRAKATVTTGASTGRFPVAVTVIKSHGRDNPVA